MSARAFELSVIGGPWARRLAPRRAWIDELPWDEQLPDDTADARVMWTRTAFNEYASAAAFAEVAAQLLAVGGHPAVGMPAREGEHGVEGGGADQVQVQLDLGQGGDERRHGRRWHRRNLSGRWDGAAGPDHQSASPRS